MLQAVIHAKCSWAWEYEDLITSAFFGPLRYLPKEDVRLILQCLFDLRLDDIDGSDWEFEFWKRIECDDRSYVEPDLIIIANGENGKKTALLIEVKWNAGESGGQGEHQVTLQARAVKKEYGDKLIPVYLVRNRAKAEKEFEGTEQPDGLKIVTWAEAGRKLRDFQENEKHKPERKLTEGGWAWLEDAGTFLKKMTGLVFTGFPDASDASCMDISLVGRIFYSPFRGFSSPGFHCSFPVRESIFYRDGG